MLTMVMMTRMMLMVMVSGDGDDYIWESWMIAPLPYLYFVIWCWCQQKYCSEAMKKNHSTAFRKCQSKGKIKFKALKKISNVDETNPDDWEQRNPIWFNLVEKEMYPNSQAPLLVQQ